MNNLNNLPHPLEYDILESLYNDLLSIMMSNNK